MFKQLTVRLRYANPTYPPCRGGGSFLEDPASVLHNDEGWFGQRSKGLLYLLVPSDASSLLLAET